LLGLAKSICVMNIWSSVDFGISNCKRDVTKVKKLPLKKKSVAVWRVYMLSGVHCVALPHGMLFAVTFVD